ncbi:mannose-6-phosphate isomerase, class I [soil metagenome]
MFVGITNTPRDYALGSHGAISELLGQRASGALEAELWLGAHHGSPARIIDPSQVGGATDLAQWIAADPVAALGSGDRLPFLLKVLAAASPLSLQAHPTPEQAIAGFARENAAGIPLTAPHRNYKDAFAKPELIYALSERFEALCGFRPAEDLHSSIGRLIALDAASANPNRGPLRRWLDRTGGDDSLGSVFEWLISRGEGVDELVARVTQLARENAGEFPTVVALADAYPGDPGIVISLMLHRVTLTQGQALYLPAGNIHAYLSGLGVELMTASDNVLRGGLTPKHIDVPELLDVLDFTPGPVPYLVPSTPREGVQVFHPEGQDFELVKILDDAQLGLTGAAILVCTEGNVHLSGEHSDLDIGRGDCVYVTPDELNLVVSGYGTVFVATTA